MTNKIDIKKYNIRVNKIPEPRSKNEALPSFFYNSIYCGQTGSGKTYKMIELLKLYEREGIYDHLGFKMGIRYILVCPTYNSSANTVYSLLKIDENDIISQYSEEKLIEKVEEVIEEAKTIKEWNAYIDAYKKFQKYDDINNMTDDELELLDKYGFENDEDLIRKQEKIYHIIFDDMASSGCFSNKKNNKINNLIILCRHHGINISILVQHLRAVPPIIRSNCKLYCIFKFANYKKLLDQVYEEVSGFLTEEQFEKCYCNATLDPNDSLVVITDNAMKNNLKIRRNWYEYLNIN